MSLERDIEDVIWGRKQWNEYVAELVQSDAIDENVVVERIELVKDSIGRQLRKAVEQNHCRLVEQAATLQGLDAAREVISSEMSLLLSNAQRMASSFSVTSNRMRKHCLVLERLYAVHHLVSALDRCERLLARLDVLNELVKRTEAICELEKLLANNACLMDVTRLRLDVIPKASRDCRALSVQQLHSSMRTLHSPMIQCCVRALRNLGAFQVEMQRVMEEDEKRIDQALLQLSSNANSCPALVNAMQSILEQYSLLGADEARGMCERIAHLLKTRLDEHAVYACRFVQLTSTMLNRCTIDVHVLRDALKPIKTAVLIHSLHELFAVVDDAFHKFPAENCVVDKVSAAMQLQLNSVHWDVQLSNEMQGNLRKVVQLCAQKMEQLLVLDEQSLQVGDHMSHVQSVNYAVLNAASALSAQWPALNTSLQRVIESGREAILTVVRQSMSSIMVSMHNEPFGAPSPYARELHTYLVALAQHTAAIPDVLYATNSNELSTFVVELFLLNASLVRPVQLDVLLLLGDDLRLIAQALSPFHCDVSAVDQMASALVLSADQLASTTALPFWVVVQLLIAQCDSSILSPHESAGWTLTEYVSWFMQHSPMDRYHLFKSLLDLYTASVVNKKHTHFVCNYHLILQVLNRTYAQWGSDRSIE